MVSMKNLVIGVVIAVVVAVGGYYSYTLFTRHNDQHAQFEALKKQHDGNMEAIQKWSLTVIKRLKQTEDDIKWLKQRDAERSKGK